jgi:hypothetical protein
VAGERSPSHPYPGLGFAGCEPRCNSAMNAMLFRQVESIFKHGRPLSPVTNVNVEAQADNKQDSSIGLVGRSKEMLHDISR